MTNAWAAAAEQFAPLDPIVASPVNYAIARSRGQFHDARHIRVMEQAILDTIALGGRLVISASVRHAKSWTSSAWTPAWYVGRNPDRRVILGAHEADFARTWGRKARDILLEHGPADFGIQVDRRSEAANRWDVKGREGGMITVGVGGSPIGRGADLMVIDDPIKSYQDAMSPLVRQRIVEWWTGTLASRVEPGGAVILIMARWHQEDLAGWLLKHHPGEWVELRLPARCDDPANDPLGRALDEPLWPERWPGEALDKARRDVSSELGEAVWFAQYQGRPQAPGGGMFPEARWRLCRAIDLPTDLRWVRAWDLAATKDGGDWTVACKMARLPDGRFVVDDVRRGQWEAADWRALMRTVAEADGWQTRIELPQDPGQAGKDQAQQLVSMLAGHDVHAQPVSGAKEVRATGYAAQQQAGNVLLVEDDWVGAWIGEHTLFPRGAADDQVDAGATAFNVLSPMADVGIRWM